MVSSVRRRVGSAARDRAAAIPRRSGRRGLELVHVGLRRPVDGDSPWLHGFGNLPDQFDLQKTIVEGRVLDLDVVGQVELAFEVPRRDTPVKKLALGFVGFAAFDGDDVLLCSD